MASESMLNMFGCDVDELVHEHVYGERDPIHKLLMMSMSIMSDAQELLGRNNGAYNDHIRKQLNVAKYLVSLADEAKVFGTIDDVPVADVIASPYQPAYSD